MHMNIREDPFENKWEQIRAQSMIWWSLITDDDLKKVEQAPIKRDKYAMLLRTKYGYSREYARAEISKRITDLEANPPSNELMRASLDRQSRAKIPKVRKNRTKNSSL